ncbi:MAG: hypothetical protein Q9167_006206 [Letrouitia subvulpina]
MPGKDQSYSSLEALTPDPGKQVIPDDGKQFVANRTGLEVAVNTDSYTIQVGTTGDPSAQRHRFSRRKRIAVTGAIVVLIILAIILGAVFGSRHTNSSTRTPSQLSNSSATSIPSAASIPSATSNSSTIAPQTLLPQRNIAAISFEANSVNHTHVYFLDNQDRVIHVFYLDESNRLHDIYFAPSTGKWTFGTLSNQGYTAMSNSSLAAMYNQCELCVNTTFIAFQDKNGFVQIGNLTAHGWVLTQLGPALDPEIGTALAHVPFYFKGMQDQINLYYQKSYLVMSLASWKPDSGSKSYHCSSRILLKLE